MAKKNVRQGLSERNGERFGIIATVGRFGQKNGWRGPIRTILLTDICDANTGTELTDHLWFTAGMWASDLHEGDRIVFEARVTKYQKGYFGHREAWDAALPSWDYRLERPTKIAKVDDQAAIRRCHSDPEFRSRVIAACAKGEAS